MMRTFHLPMLTGLLLAFLSTLIRAETGNPFTMEQVLHFAYPGVLTAAESADAIAWVQNLQGERNVWLARGPDFRPLQVTRFTGDDGQELSQLTFSPDGAYLVFVRGGDHDANWPAEGNREPDPSRTTAEPAVRLWLVSRGGKALRMLAEGDHPALSKLGFSVCSHQ